jgi:hypothetical protein
VPRSESEPSSTATATEAAAGGSNALERRTYNGFSMLVPTDWKQENDHGGVDQMLRSVEREG